MEASGEITSEWREKTSVGAAHLLFQPPPLTPTLLSQEKLHVCTPSEKFPHPNSHQLPRTIAASTGDAETSFWGQKSPHSSSGDAGTQIDPFPPHQHLSREFALGCSRQPYLGSVSAPQWQNSPSLSSRFPFFYILLWNSFKKFLNYF